MKTTVPLLLTYLISALGCAEGESTSASAGAETPAESSRAVRSEDGALTVHVALPADAGPGLQGSAEDLLEALTRITGASAPDSSSMDAPTAPLTVSVVVDEARTTLGSDGYAITSTRGGLTVTARTQWGAMYGLYHLTRAVGVRYYHPKETFFPTTPALTLPKLEVTVTPAFELRGFHEHTQHPIVMSDFLLRPGREDFRAEVSEHLRWLARTGQNAFFFHALKTLDLDDWAPYMRSITDEARQYGIKMGVVTSFSDQQQHNFKLISDEGAEAAPQIRDSIDRILAGGLDFIEFQIGTSEFTKPADAQVLGWIQVALDHVGETHPGVKAYAWIHITCSLEDESGGKFFHLPLQSDTTLGAFVHTTMFYTLDDPAPVYDCATFEHQIDFMNQADTEREMVFFPETAWWLGFDNNLPLAMPVTGWSREKDIQTVLGGWDVTGHVTFTTGREWGYWRYDHYLTRATWDSELTWDDYLDWVAPVFGDQGQTVAKALQDWTALQRQHLYGENPLIYFYLAGELPQDEAGAQAGVLARRPKIPFKEVLAMDGSTFDAWKVQDYDMLARMEGEYTAPLATLTPG